MSNFSVSPVAEVPTEVRERAVLALEKLLENFAATAEGKHFEISKLETDFTNADYLGIKVHFRTVSPVIPLEGKPA
jgi:hypothetical protein